MTKSEDGVYRPELAMIETQELELLKAKARCMEVLSDKLTEIGFDTKTMTFADQMDLVLKMSIDGVDSLYVTRIQALDAYVQSIQTYAKNAFRVMDEYMAQCRYKMEMLSNTMGLLGTDADDIESYFRELAVKDMQLTVKIEMNRHLFFDHNQVPDDIKEIG